MDRNIKGKFIKGHKSFRIKRIGLCSVNGCGKSILSRGFCGLHYQRNKKYGNPTEISHRIGRPKIRKEFACLICKKIFYRRISEIEKGSYKFCSKECGYIFGKGKLKNITPIENRKWFISKKGYLATTIRRKWIWQHRWIVETKILHRALKKEEIIHHLNGIKTDNRIENLAICSNKSHYEFIKRLQERIKELENRLL